MKIKLLLILLISSTYIYAQDTFSICAVDSATGQVGSAGATCIASSSFGAFVISDVHPGYGVVHTQAYYHPTNQNYGRDLMNLHTLTPQQVIDSLLRHDVDHDSTHRQYGVVDLTGGGRSAAFTGSNADSYKKHKTGSYYSIQGNTLIGTYVIDSMEARFLRTTGSLACRLMAALQGANIVGADNRCTSNGTSSYSAFIRVANPGDTWPLYLDEYVNTYPSHKEPIDSLQTIFDQHGFGCSAAGISSYPDGKAIAISPNPVENNLQLAMGNWQNGSDRFQSRVLNILGESVQQFEIRNPQSAINIDVSTLSKGVYFLRLTGESIVWTGKFVKD